MKVICTTHEAKLYWLWKVIAPRRGQWASAYDLHLAPAVGVRRGDLLTGFALRGPDKNTIIVPNTSAGGVLDLDQVLVMPLAELRAFRTTSAQAAAGSYLFATSDPAGLWSCRRLQDLAATEMRRTLSWDIRPLHYRTFAVGGAQQEWYAEEFDDSLCDIELKWRLFRESS